MSTIVNRHTSITSMVPTAEAFASAPAPTVTVTLPPADPPESRWRPLLRLVAVGLVVRLAGDASEAAARHLLRLNRSRSA